MKLVHRLLPPLFLFILVFTLFAPSLRYDLVEQDDHLYLLSNPMVGADTPSDAVHAAFSTFFEATYAPLLWCSYALDVFLFHTSPTAPWGYHFSNILLHAANAVLFSLLLSHFCKKRFLVFFCVAFWALHPLRVESVAWLAERKDVLSGFFVLLSVFAWLRFLRPSSSHTIHAFRYLLSLFLFAAALLVKSSAAPLPAVLLLLDVWPLRRIPLGPVRATLRATAIRIAEKIPFFALALASSALSTAAHAEMGVLRNAPLVLRLASVPVHVAFYIVKTVLPFRLSPFYLDLPITLPRLLVSLFLLAVFAAMAIRLRRRVPALLLGLLVFCVFLIPVSGIVRFGIQSIADRFTYLPALGLSVALTALPVPSAPSRRRIAALVPIAVLLACVAATLRLLPAWRNPDALLDRVLSCTPSQPRILVAKATRLLNSGRPADALPLAATAAQVFDPYSFVNARVLHATLLQELDRPADALPVLLDIPRDVMNPARLCAVDWELARIRFALGRFGEALADADHAIAEMPSEERPAHLLPLRLLAMSAAHRAGHMNEALAHARAFPPYAAKTTLSDTDLLPFYLHEWANQHRTASAPFFRTLLVPDANPVLANNVVWGLATADRSPIPPDEILAAATRLAPDAPQNPSILDTLAAAQARAGHFADAQATLLKALDLLSSVPPSPDRNLFANQLRIRLDLYRQNCPCSENAFARWFAAIANQPPQPLPAP